MQEEAFQENYDQAIQSDDFDEDWEKALLKFVIQIQHLEDRQITSQDFLQF